MSTFDERAAEWDSNADRLAMTLALADAIIAHLAPTGLETVLDLGAGTATAPFLTTDGLLCLTAGNQVFTVTTPLHPCPGGWAMSRGNPQRSGQATGILITELATSGPVGQLTFSGVPGAGYAVEESTNLSNWQKVADAVGTAELTKVPLTLQPGDRCRFYRVREQ